MEGWHRAGFDGAAASGESAALHQLEAFAQFFDELGRFQQIVAVIGVGHDDVLAASGGNASLQGRAVTAVGDADDSGTTFGSNSARSVGAAVIGDDHFTANAGFVKQRGLLW